MLDKAANAGCHTFAERGLDLYETPPAAVKALLRAEKIPPAVWVRGAGRGAIVSVLRAHGHTVFASDIRDYGFQLDRQRDFLQETATPAGIEVILTNPPYRYAAEFVTHALNLCPLVVMLLRLAFLESERRSPLIDRGQLARVHVFKDRLPMMHRDGWAGPRASSAIAFAWFLWHAGHCGPTTIDRISWRACR